MEIKFYLRYIGLPHTKDNSAGLEKKSEILEKPRI